MQLCVRCEISILGKLLADGLTASELMREAHLNDRERDFRSLDFTIGASAPSHKE